MGEAVEIGLRHLPRLQPRNLDPMPPRRRLRPRVRRLARMPVPGPSRIDDQIEAEPLSLGAQGGLSGFNTGGLVTATIAGALGAIGAACIIYAFRAGGLPVYVMPLVFGGAPIVNVLVSMAMNPPKDAVNPLLYAGFVLAAAGAGMVLDHHRLAEIGAQPLRDHPGNDVGRSARRERHDQGDRAGRVVLGVDRGCEQRRRAEDE